MPVHYIYLLMAVAAETIGTTALQASQQFSKLLPSVIVVLAYAVSFYLLALTLKFMPVGVMYAIWSGLGILFIALIAWIIFGQKRASRTFGINHLYLGIPDESDGFNPRRPDSLARQFSRHSLFENRAEYRS